MERNTYPLLSFKGKRNGFVVWLDVVRFRAWNDGTLDTPWYAVEGGLVKEARERGLLGK